MGGPPSALMWNMGYDPIVGGTYVDDIVGFHRGPRRALRMQSLLLAALHAAGLLAVATHTCVKMAAT
eukprot:9937120-Lingulodinium_polyedra.AAC.1